MYKISLLSFLLACSLVPALAAPSPVQISAVKKTGARQQSEGKPALGGGTATRTGKSVYYRFTLRSMSPKVASAKAQWVILVEGKLGVLRVGARGTETLKLPIGREVEFDTTGADLSSVAWKGVKGLGIRNRRGKLEDEIKGYALQVFDASGKKVAEKYSSREVEEKAEEYFARHETLRDRLRKLPAKPPSPFK